MFVPEFTSGTQAAFCGGKTAGTTFFSGSALYRGFLAAFREGLR
jgi:hypothetical protein